MFKLPGVNDAPGNNRPNQTELMVAQVLNAAAADRQLQAALYTNAGAVFALSGFPLLPWNSPEFNQYFKDVGGLDTVQAMTAGQDLVQLGGVGCTVCKIAAYTVAAVIVAVGAAGLATLSVTSGPVLALAAFAGVEAGTALAFIASLGGAISGGVKEVAARICAWTGAC